MVREPGLTASVLQGSQGSSSTKLFTNYKRELNINSFVSGLNSGEIYYLMIQALAGSDIKYDLQIYSFCFVLFKQEFLRVFHYSSPNQLSIDQTILVWVESVGT